MIESLGRRGDFCLNQETSPAKAKFEEVNFERSEGGDEDVESHVKLLSTDEKGIVDVSGDDVGLLHQVGVEHRPALPRPLLQLGQLVDQEDPAALRLSARLHDPRGVGVLPAEYQRSICLQFLFFTCTPQQTCCNLLEE